VAGVAYAITPPKGPQANLGAVTEDGTVRPHAPAGRFNKTRKPAKGTKGTNTTKQPFLRRLEDRWDRRRDEGQ